MRIFVIQINLSTTQDTSENCVHMEETWGHQDIKVKTLYVITMLKLQYGKHRKYKAQYKNTTSLDADAETTKLT